MRNGESVAAFEREFAQYVGAKYAIALCNGTATLHTALVALGVKPGDRVAVPPLTMSATTMAVLHAGAVPVFCDVDPQTWLMDGPPLLGNPHLLQMGVSLYGLHCPTMAWDIDDAAQTLRKHGDSLFTSYSFQASKILALGEGGMLVTNDESLATRAREFSSLGYRMRADQPRIDPAVLKSPTYKRHHSLGWNYRMNDLTASMGLFRMGLGDSPPAIDRIIAERRTCAAMYRDAIDGCDWLTLQHVPDGWTHDYWTYAVAITDDAWVDPPASEGPDAEPHNLCWRELADLIVKHGGERPYAAWRLTYQEPAFEYLRPGWRDPRCGTWMRGDVSQPYCEDCETFDELQAPCPIAEDLQPRLMQFQTNNLASAARNAAALRAAIQEIGG
jgi:perosamine synthetase